MAAGQRAHRVRPVTTTERYSEDAGAKSKTGIRIYRCVASVCPDDIPCPGKRLYDIAGYVVLTDIP